jgi:uncharacterized membrane protein YdbT with pleckstrin-like domain
MAVATNQTDVLVDKPQARALVVYYALSFFVILISLIGAIIYITGSLQSIALYWHIPLVGVVGGLGILSIVVYIHLEMRSADYAITENSAHARWGLVVKHNESIQLGSVRSIKVSQGIIQRLFNLGNLILYTTSSDYLVLWDLDRPAEKKELIWKLVQQEASRRQYYQDTDR